MVPGQRLRTAKSCKGGTQVPDTLIRTFQLREITLTEKPRPSKVAGDEHRASNPCLGKIILLKNLNGKKIQD